MYLTAMIPGATFVPGETCLILDELQECPEARTALKFFKTDGRYDVICTGSLLGVSGYGTKKKKKDQKKGTSVPVDFETIVDMNPLDLEEFLWANGITPEIIDKLHECLEKEIPVPEAIHKRMNDIFLQYIVVGGMPEAVGTFLQNHDIGQVLQVQRNIVDEYKDDMVKYADDADRGRRHHFQMLQSRSDRTSFGWQCRGQHIQGLYAGFRPVPLYAGTGHAV